MVTMIIQTESVKLSKNLLHHQDGFDEDALHQCDDEEILHDEADDDDTESVELSKDLLHQSKTCPQATTAGHWEER